MTHLILAGFMGTGKHTVGRQLAARLGWAFVDVEAEIEGQVGTSLARMLDEEGDGPVRAVEARTLRAVLLGPRAVVVLGGGGLMLPETALLVKRAGPVVCLVADPSTIYQRVQAQAGQRPLLKVANPLATIRDLLHARQSAYAQADVQIDTTHQAPEGVVEEVLDWLTRVRVNLGARAYDIHIRAGCHADLGTLLVGLPTPVTTAVVISSRQIDRHYGDRVRASLTAAGLPHQTLLVPAGERYKSLDTAGRLYGDLITRKVDRKAIILALGGGVIGDLAGFVAATYQRGIRFLQLPTTLLAHVDSSIGGKVGVNHVLGKNMIGAFLQPQAVLIDPGVLATLPPREFRSGLAEVVKYGVIWDEEFFAYLEGHIDAILRLEPDALQHIIRRSCQIKAHVVEEDETESGLRAILNYGHTVAHAIETYTSYERYTHGEAVAIGMVVAARIAHALGMLRADPVHRIIRLLERCQLPTHLPTADPGVLMSLMDTDKKAEAGKVRFVLPTKIGRVELVSAISRDVLRRAMQESIER
jgi:shikimate kinase/3-dehydroquinate synthase